MWEERFPLKSEAQNLSTSTFAMLVVISSLAKCHGLVEASKKSTMQPPLPQPGCGGEWKETGRNWWVTIRAV